MGILPKQPTTAFIKPDKVTINTWRQNRGGMPVRHVIPQFPKVSILAPFYARPVESRSLKQIKRN